MAIFLHKSQTPLVFLCAVCALCAPIGHARTARGPAAPPGLLPLSAQTFPVPDVPVDVPLDPAGKAADAGDGAVVQYGLLDVPGLPPSAYDYHLEELEYRAAASPGALASAPDLGLRGAGALQGWTLGTRNWRYAGSSGYGLTIGNARSPAQGVGHAVRLAGVRLAGSTMGMETDRWDYAVAAGALDDAGSGLDGGALDYGPAAYDVSTRYALDSGLSLATRAQGAAGQLTTGIGGEYAAGAWGTAALGAARSHRAGQGGWQYQAGYAVDLPWQAMLSWHGERRGPAYSDLSLLQSGAAGCHCTLQQWELGLAAGRWGRFSGLYERSQGGATGLEQRFGVSQRFLLGQRLRVQLEADRQPAVGAYGLAAKFSLPLY